MANYYGSGLKLYGNSLGHSLMQFSLANQPSLSLEKDQLTDEEYNSKINVIKRNQLIIILCDIVCTIVMMGFVIFWIIKS